jgi:phosphatidylglycerophosphate synthase
LFQLAAVIDCSDGEVARLTFTESPFGAWLDLALDNVVHMAIFSGIAIGAFRQAAGGEDAWIPLALGTAAILGNAVSFLLVQKAQNIKAASEWKTPLHAAWSDFMLRNVASRDFSVVVFVFALFGKLNTFLWLAAIGSLAFAGVMLWILRPAAVARPSA